MSNVLICWHLMCRLSTGHVYLRYYNKEDAMKAQQGMHKRWFDRRSISAIFMVRHSWFMIYDLFCFHLYALLHLFFCTFFKSHLVQSNHLSLQFRRINACWFGMRHNCYLRLLEGLNLSAALYIVHVSVLYTRVLYSIQISWLIKGSSFTYLPFFWRTCNTFWWSCSMVMLPHTWDTC